VPTKSSGLKKLLKKYADNTLVGGKAQNPINFAAIKPDSLAH
jgi:hypothetical protein